jgi:competence CoiA-like predicted nuclease
MAIMGESMSHLIGKTTLVSELLRHPDYQDADISLEVPVYEAGRVADVMVSYPSGQKEVHEIQLSNQSLDDFQSRTSDYNRSGCDVIWWLGENALTEDTRQWCMMNQGSVCQVRFEYE